MRTTFGGVAVGTMLVLACLVAPAHADALRPSPVLGVYLGVPLDDSSAARVTNLPFAW